MAIQLNQLNTSPLAAIAGSNTGNLGLGSYAIDAGAVMKGAAEGQWKAAQLQELYARQQTNIRIQELADSGAMDRTVAQNLSAQNQKEMELAYQKLRDTEDRAVEQQKADQLAQFQQGQLGVQQGQLGLNAQQLMAQTQAKQQELGIQQQEANQLGQFQNNQIGIQQQHVDIAKQKAQQDQQLQQIQMLAAQKEEQIKTLGSYASVTYMASQIKDPKQRQEAIESILTNGVKSGDVPQELADSFRQMSPIEQQLKAAQLMSMAGAANIARGKADKAGMEFTTGADGSISLAPKRDTTDLDKALAKSDAAAANKASDSRESMDIMLNSIQKAKQDLAATPEMALGPVRGLFSGKVSERAQVLESSLNTLALQAKELFKLGSGQGFTDADREFLVKIEGGLKNYKGAIGELLDRAETLAKHVQVASWIKENNIRQGTERYDQWKLVNPEPMVKMVDPKGKDPHMVPASQMKALIAKGAKQVD